MKVSLFKFLMLCPLMNSQALVAENFEYHDNKVILQTSDGYSIVKGSYTVDDFSITSKQDPKEHIWVGQETRFDERGEMTFTIGRSVSTEVSQWFENTIEPNQNTFNKKPDNLSFSFVGRLEMTLTGSILGKGQRTYVFEDIVLAQGKSSTKHNWWFGGKHCRYIGDNKVNCQGLDDKNKKVMFVFTRGHNGNNKVDIKPTSPYDLTNWMSDVPGLTRVDEIMMPGSHDAGMSEGHHCKPALLAEPYTLTQKYDIGEQMMRGVRYFDLRIDYDKGDLVTYHRSGGKGCNGMKLKKVLDQTQDFLAHHKDETVILKFSHIRKYDGHSPDETKKKIIALLAQYPSNLFYKTTNSETNIATLNLEQVRGKTILVFDYKDYIDPSNGLFLYKDNDRSQAGTHLTVFDKYSNTQDYNKMAQDQLDKWNLHAGLGQGHLFLLSWTLTPSSKTVSSLASKANKNLANILSERILLKQYPKPNIVFLDYIDASTGHTIIQYNF